MGGTAGLRAHDWLLLPGRCVQHRLDMFARVRVMALLAVTLRSVAVVYVGAGRLAGGGRLPGVGIDQRRPRQWTLIRRDCPAHLQFVV